MPDPVIPLSFWQSLLLAIVSGVFTAIPILAAVRLAHIALRSKMLDQQTSSEARSQLQLAKMEVVVAKVDQVKELANGLSSKLVAAVSEKENLKGVLEEKSRVENEIAIMAKGAVEERERSEFRKELIVEANGAKEARSHKQEGQANLDVTEMTVDKMTVNEKQP